MGLGRIGKKGAGNLRTRPVTVLATAVLVGPAVLLMATDSSGVDLDRSASAPSASGPFRSPGRAHRRRPRRPPARTVTKAKTTLRRVKKVLNPFQKTEKALRSVWPRKKDKARKAGKAAAMGHGRGGARMGVNDLGLLNPFELQRARKGSPHSGKRRGKPPFRSTLRPKLRVSEAGLVNPFNPNSF